MGETLNTFDGSEVLDTTSGENILIIHFWTFFLKSKIISSEVPAILAQIGLSQKWDLLTHGNKESLC
jgi:hypothetical protein